MAGRKIKTARNIAVTVLNQFDSTGNYVGPMLDKLLARVEQKQQATDICLGCMRNRSAIDAAIAKLADCPVERIPSGVLNIIRVGAFELIYSPATAEYAIVSEAVENAKAVAGKKQTAFVNAVLRQIARHIRNRQISLSETNAQRALPQTMSIGCEFDADILPNPKDSPADFLSAAFSLPKWLISDWLDEYGEELARQICFASNRRPGIYIRPNALKTTIQTLADSLREEGIDLEIVCDEEMIRVKSPRAITELPGFAEGLFSVQDISAARPLRLLQPKQQWTILDLCAAPGTKTTQLAELTADKAKIVATDIDGERLKKVRENTTRLGIKSVTVVEYEKLFENSKPSQFDAVLLDVPCSNTGVLAKRIEARYRIKPKAIKELAKIQDGLLKTAASMIKPKGKICYSTCSIQKCENSELVRDFLQKNPGFELETERLTLPSAQAFDNDGGYAAIITGK
ncbi:MAG: transcription antitermination factor NusB [Phycisphaerae bacterium]|nr:transcription antitermination factor NusB [Phycisphaerae bacterium]MDD5380513.1 transcription antitermination factor NusB [Phycisphaerae bacterium]